MPTTSATFATHLLGESSRERFQRVSAQVLPHAICQWRETQAQQAQLWLVDASSPIPAGAQPLCMIYVGPTVPQQLPPVHWLTRLDIGYTAADLTDVLHRAAVFLGDWGARHRACLLRDAGPPASAAPQRWRLRAWPSLGAPYDSGQHLCALALLSREAVTADQIRRHAGLDDAHVRALLAELQRRGMVRAVPASVTVPAAGPAAVPIAPPASATWGVGPVLASQPAEGPGPAAAGLARQLSSWVGGEGHGG